MLVSQTAQMEPPLSTLTHNENVSTSNLQGRTVIELPAQVKYRADWEKVGVIWNQKLETPDNEKQPVFGLATLPEGWRVCKDESGQCVSENDYHFDLYDDENIKRVGLSVLHANFGKYGYARFYHENKMLAQRVKQRLMEIPIDMKLVVENRKTEWSKEHPFIVIYSEGKRINQCNEWISSKWLLGYFSTYEIASKAGMLLHDEALCDPSSTTIYDPIIWNETEQKVHKYHIGRDEIFNKWCESLNLKLHS